MGVTIYGAGAVGGRTGAYLARAGEDVLLVDKVAEHVEAMNRGGLKITGGDTFTVPVRACLPEDLRGPLGLTILAVKAQDTDAALDVIAPLVGAETLLLSMQNGLNPERIAARIGADRVIGAFINYPADWLGPGHVEQGGPARIWLGELDGRMTERLDRLGGLLSKMGDTTVRLTDNVYGYLWAKMIYALPLFAQALTDETIADVFDNKGLQRLLVSMCGEGTAVAEAAGIDLEVIPPFEPAKMRPRNEVEMAEACAVMGRIADHQRPQTKQRSGIWRDIAVRHRPTEVGPQVGAFVIEGEKRGIAVPLIRRLMAMINEVERGERQRGLHNLKELDQLRVG